MKRVIDRRTILLSTGAVTGLSLLPTTGLFAGETASVKPAAPPPVSAFAGSPLVDQIALSPDGKSVAAITQDGDYKILVTFKIADMKPSRIAIGNDKVRGLFWGDNTHVIMIDSTTASLPEFAARGEFYLARSIDITTGTIRTFFARQRDTAPSTGSLLGSTARYYPIVFSPIQRIRVNGESRITASNYRMTDSYDKCLFSFGLDSESGNLLLQGSVNTDDFVVTPDGQVLAVSEYDEDKKEWTLRYVTEPEKGRHVYKPIYQTKGLALSHPELIGLGRDGASVVISINHGDDSVTGYHEISADGVLSPPLDTGSAGQDSTPLFNPVTLRLAGFSRHDDWITHAYFDPLMKTLNDSLPKVVGEGYRSVIKSCAEDPRQMIVYTEGPGDAGSYYSVDFTTGAITPIASNYPNLPEDWISEKQAIDYKAADGLSIHAYLTLPPFKDPKNLPLIVLPHGGPQARDYIGFDWQAQCLAAWGYAVLQPNFRGSQGYGYDFVAAGHGQFGRKMQTDLSDGVRYLIGRGLVDAKRVAILGASYGGYAAVAGATLDPGVYNCAVAIAGVTDPKSFIDFVSNKYGSDDSSGVIYWHRFMGDPNTYDEISPVKQAAKASCPILLLHGTDDTVVPISQSQRMESALKAAGKPVEFITFKGQTHWEDIGSLRIEMMNAAIGFLAKHNPAN